jgi:hypothetical protein
MLSTANLRAQSDSIRYPLKAVAPPTLISLAISDSIRYTYIFLARLVWINAKGEMITCKTTKDRQGF